MKETPEDKKDECCSPAEKMVEQIAEKTAENNIAGRTSRKESKWVNREWIAALISALLLLSGLAIDTIWQPNWFSTRVALVWYAIGYIPVGYPVVAKGVKLALKGEVFTEFLLMGIATIGAFYIGEYPEGVAVMLFYTIGELFQGAAVGRAKRSISALLDVRPDKASVFHDGDFVTVHADNVAVDQTIRVKAGERVPLDGEMLSAGGSFNTAALTGESKPMYIEKGEKVLAGMINESGVVELRVTRLFHESSLARILSLVQNAQGRKAKTELFIRRFARVYTPIVVFLAAALTFLPWFFVADYHFDQWLYRALIFLVISCPCALVVAIPLGYFGGIGAGSRNGILFKGSSFLDRMTRIDTVVLDKTGTLTKGVFAVQRVESAGLPPESWLPLLAALERQSNHPVSKAITSYVNGGKDLEVQNMAELKGRGLQGHVAGREVLAGNAKLLTDHGVPLDSVGEESAATIVFVAVDRRLAGYVTIADEVRADSAEAIRKMHASGIRTFMLSGDRQIVVDGVARSLGISEAYGDLLPEDKVTKVEAFKKGRKGALAFVGDGINDAPVLAVSDVGIAMGGLGSDAAIETADVVIQTDQPSKIVTAIKIGKATNAIIWQNIFFAFAVKILVMAMGAWGLASMWEAVFADVGVALLAILNAVRIQRRRF